MSHPRMGERVRVRPTNPLVPVQRGARLYGQFLPAEGQEVLWDEFLHQRLVEGSIAWAPITSEPAAPSAQPVEQPSGTPPANELAKEPS